MARRHYGDEDGSEIGPDEVGAFIVDRTGEGAIDYGADGVRDDQDFPPGRDRGTTVRPHASRADNDPGEYTGSDASSGYGVGHGIGYGAPSIDMDRASLTEAASTPNMGQGPADFDRDGYIDNGPLAGAWIGDPGPGGYGDSAAEGHSGSGDDGDGGDGDGD